MSDRNEKDVQNDKQILPNSEASGSAMECNPPLPEASGQHIVRIPDYIMNDPNARKELVKALEGMQNMAIAHEIAVDQNFKINKIEPEDDTLYKKVKDMVHKAYWDILSNELSQNPPVYTQALQLLQEMKQFLDELIFPHNTKLKENMNEVLDIALIKQQAENGVLDFSHYAQYVISLMSKICAPARDEIIAELKKCTDVVETFKGIMETLVLMKVDLTNFTINVYRPTIIASSVEFEKLKFAEFLKVQVDGLRNTRSWLLRHLTPELSSALSTNANSIKRITHSLLVEAYLDLLEFDFFPSAETLILDQERIIDLRNKTSRLAINGSILLLLKSLPRLLTDQYINIIKDHVMVLLETVNSNKDLEVIMPNILIQVKTEIQKVQQLINNVEILEHNNSLLILENQLIELVKPDHKVRQLVISRIRQFLKSVIVSQSAVSQQIPPGLLILEKELTDIATNFVAFVTRNKAVFEEYYQNIVTETINEKQSSCNESTKENKT